MVTRQPEAMMDGVRNLFNFGAMGAWTDDQLVARFLAQREGSEVAFRVLIQRHGPMVLGVCHRVLGDCHLAEDTFQATFLVLVKKAGTLRDRDLLANWLYGVAHRLAKKARAEAARRTAVEQGAARSDVAPEEDLDRDELRSVVDEEIRRLPDRYRAPLVLCYLEGLHHHEVARRLGCPVGTVESRLSRARRRLQSQLTRRGLAPLSSTLAAMLAPSRATAAFERLAESTFLAARRAAANFPHPAPLASLTASATQVPRAPLLARPGAVWATLLSVGAVAGGLSLVLAAKPVNPRPDTPVPPPQSEVISDVEVPDLPDTPVADVPVPATPPQPTRSPSAVARPLRDIQLDGDLADWPSDMPRYPIRHAVTNNSAYRIPQEGNPDDPDAYFQAGYDPQSGLIYLGVVVRDANAVASPADPWHTDAVEVYVDGSFSTRVMPSLTGDPWSGLVEASRMPALQYVAVPGEVGAYGDKANPSLVYGRISDTTTKMRYRRTGDVLIYEWAIQPFDRYPDTPTQLHPGKRIGLDVAVVDKDSQRDRPAWVSWAPVKGMFKGFDSGLLGELILGDDP